MPTALHAQLQQLAASFAESVLAAIRGASLEELLAESGSPSRGTARGLRTGVLRTDGPAVAKASPRFTGRLPRRSPEQIAKTIEQVVALVRKHKDGLRAEQIRTELGLQAKEMPRVLREAIGSKKLRAKGQKRATTYFAK